MIEANLRWVVAIAKKYCRNQFSDERLQEAIQSGILGLTRAVEKFAPARGYKLSTFSYYWIWQTIQRGEENKTIVRLPDQVMQEYRKIERAIAKLQSLGLPLTPQLLADETGLTTERISQRIEIGKVKCVASLDATNAQFNGDHPLLDAIPAPEHDWEEHLMMEAKKDWLEHNLDALPARTREVFDVARRLSTHRDAAAQLGLSRASIGNHMSKAKTLLRQRLAEQQAAA